MPTGATCSAVISAACHAPAGDEEGYKFPLQWGVIPHQNDPISALSNETELSEDRQSVENPQDYLVEDPMGAERQSASSSANGRIQPEHCCFTTSRHVVPPTEGQIYI